VFPIWGKILTPRFWVSEKRNLGKPVFFSGFEMNALLSDETTTVGPAQFISELLIKLSTVFQ